VLGWIGPRFAGNEALSVVNEVASVGTVAALATAVDVAVVQTARCDESQSSFFRRFMFKPHIGGPLNTASLNFLNALSRKLLVLQKHGTFHQNHFLIWFLRLYLI